MRKTIAGCFCGVDCAACMPYLWIMNTTNTATTKGTTNMNTTSAKVAPFTAKITGGECDEAFVREYASVEELDAALAAIVADLPATGCYVKVDCFLKHTKTGSVYACRYDVQAAGYKGAPSIAKRVADYCRSMVEPMNEAQAAFAKAAYGETLQERRIESALWLGRLEATFGV